jgi:hypothetical protein
MPVSVSKIGHIVLKSKTSILPWPSTAASSVLRKSRGETSAKSPMAFLSTGNSHHDIALVAADSPSSVSGSLHHFALKVGDSLQGPAAC